jgi:hypothetical protein
MGLLDTLTNTPSAAYGVRKLRTAYSGSAIRVRRSSDDTEQDIGFSGDDLDTTALLAFVGANNGFDTTWYDQTTNARNLTQTFGPQQPQIVASGALLSFDNGRAGMLGASSNSTGMSYIEGSAFITGTSLYVAAIFSPAWGSSGNFGRVFGTSKDGTTGDFNDAANAAVILRDGSSNQYNGQRNSVALGGVAAVSEGEDVSLIGRFDGTDYQLYKNNVPGSASASTGSFSIRALGIFADLWNFGSIAGGLMGELIVGSTLTDEDRGKIYQSQGEYFLGLDPLRQSIADRGRRIITHSGARLVDA